MAYRQVASFGGLRIPLHRRAPDCRRMSLSPGGVVPGGQITAFIFADVGEIWPSAVRSIKSSPRPALRAGVILPLSPFSVTTATGGKKAADSHQKEQRPREGFLIEKLEAAVESRCRPSCAYGTAKSEI